MAMMNIRTADFQEQQGRPDIVVYPDSDKVRAAERLPAGDGFSASFHRGDAVDYWDGEAHS